MDLKDELLSKIMFGRWVNLINLAAVYSPIIDRSRQTYRMRALVFCPLSRFLFVNKDNGAYFSNLITVAEQLEVGRIAGH